MSTFGFCALRDEQPGRPRSSWAMCIPCEDFLTTVVAKKSLVFATLHPRDKDFELASPSEVPDL